MFKSRKQKQREAFDALIAAARKYSQTIIDNGEPSGTLQLVAGYRFEDDEQRIELFNLAFGDSRMLVTGNTMLMQDDPVAYQASLAAVTRYDVKSRAKLN